MMIHGVKYRVTKVCCCMKVGSTMMIHGVKYRVTKVWPNGDITLVSVDGRIELRIEPVMPS